MKRRSPSVSGGELGPDRIKHLEFLQSTIARQASHSFAVKGWSLTVATAIYAYTAGHLTWWLALVALLPVGAFAWLDAFYLRQERLFRELYHDASLPDSPVRVFDMSTSPYQEREFFPRCSYRSVCGSKTWWVLHLTIALVGLLLLVIAIFQRVHSAEATHCICHLI